MTITPHRNSFTIHCDGCFKSFEVDSDKFDDVIDFIKLNNWKTHVEKICNKSGKCSHKCVACQEGR